jgi:hypothetical protein
MPLRLAYRVGGSRWSAALSGGWFARQDASDFKDYFRSSCVVSAWLHQYLHRRPKQQRTASLMTSLFATWLAHSTKHAPRHPPQNTQRLVSLDACPEAAAYGKYDCDPLERDGRPTRRRTRCWFRRGEVCVCCQGRVLVYLAAL